MARDPDRGREKDPPTVTSHAPSETDARVMTRWNLHRSRDDGRARTYPQLIVAEGPVAGLARSKGYAEPRYQAEYWKASGGREEIIFRLSVAPDRFSGGGQESQTGPH